MKIGILQAGHFVPELQAELGDYTTLYARLLSGHDHEFEFETFSVVDMEFPTSTEVADGWLISGSKHGAYEDHPFIPPLEDLIRAIHASGKPLVGICFGHQIIAQAMGGKVEKFDDGWSVGRVEYEMSGKGYALNAWHQDQIIVPPEGATTVGSSGFCTHAALVYGDQIWTMQPHPEFESPAIDGLIRLKSDEVEPDRVSHAKAQLPAANDNAQIGKEMAAFFLKERA
jgi:GMP synthase-like glutamine amidotransferase